MTNSKEKELKKEQGVKKEKLNREKEDTKNENMPSKDNYRKKKTYVKKKTVAALSDKALVKIVSQDIDLISRMDYEQYKKLLRNMRYKSRR